MQYDLILCNCRPEHNQQTTPTTSRLHCAVCHALSYYAYIADALNFNEGTGAKDYSLIQHSGSKPYSKLIKLVLRHDLSQGEIRTILF